MSNPAYARYDTDENGVLIFEVAIQLQNSNYKVDPDDPKRLIPIWPDCIRRRMSLRTLNCGLRRATYTCDKFNKKVTFKDCEGCDAKEPGLQPTEPPVNNDVAG